MLRFAKRALCVMSKTVLVIDDDDILRAGIARGLRDAQFSVITAANAEYANEIMMRMTVDAIVLDRMMTGMDGLSFLKKIRAQGDKTPTIILTAMGGPENTIDGLMCGADDYLAKPFQIRELILRLNNIISRASPADDPKMPNGLYVSDNEFFIKDKDDKLKLIALSGEEKKLLQNLTNPVGCIVSAQPMVVKRLRGKLNDVLSNLDIVTVRGYGYKMICFDNDRTQNQKV